VALSYIPGRIAHVPTSDELTVERLITSALRVRERNGFELGRDYQRGQSSMGSQ
jgi:hypothetical protein